MLNSTSKVPFAFLIAGIFALSACGGDAESAWDDLDDDRTVAEMEADAAEALAEVEAEAADAAPPATQAQPPRVERTSPAPAPSAPVAREAVIPAGTMVPLTIETTLSTQNSVVGDLFHAVVNQEIIGSDGMVLIPQGARVQGHVTESRKSTGSDDDAVLGIALDHFVMNGREYPISATVVSTTMEVSSEDSGTRTATKVATGAAAGAVVGRILGRDTRSTIQGAAAGAVAGTAVALATREGNAVLREGSEIIVRLDREVPLVAAR